MSSSKFIKCRSDIKICIVGQCGVGKTSFGHRWVEGLFEDKYTATIMSGFSYKLYEYKGNYYKIQLWDIAGQDKNIYTSRVFTKNAHGILVICDATSNQSLEATIKWKNAIDDNAQFLDGNPLPALLVRNKMDLVQEDEGKKNEIRDFAKQNGFFDMSQISCKTGDGIDETMDLLLTNVIDKIEAFYAEQHVDLDDVKKTSIVQQNPSPTATIMLTKQNKYIPNCC